MTPPAPLHRLLSVHLRELVILGLLVLLILSVPIKSIEADLDPSWQGALTHSFQHGDRFGRDVVFTYGPLGFLATERYAGAYFPARFVWEIVMKTLLALLILLRLRPLPLSLALPPLLLLAYMPMPGQDGLWLLGILATFLLLMDHFAPADPGAPPPSRLHTLLLAAAALLFLLPVTLLKFTFLLAILAVALPFILLLALRRRPLAALAALVLLLGGHLLGWKLCGQSSRLWFDYLRTSWEIATGYQGMTVQEHPIPLIHSLALLLLVALSALLWWLSGWLLSGPAPVQPARRPLLARLSRLLAFLPPALPPAAFCVLVFLQWKHGILRADGGHLPQFATFVPIALFLTLVSASPANPVNFTASLLSVLRPFLALISIVPALLINLHFYPELTQRGPLHPLLRINDSLAALLRPTARQQDLQSDWDHQAEQTRLPQIAAIIGNQTVDVFGHLQAYALLNRWNYHPRPIYQSYQTNTPALMRLNEDFYLSPRAPQFVLATVENTIDNHPPGLTDSLALRALLYRYDYRITEGKFLLLERKPAPPAITLQPWLQGEQPFGQAWTLPPDNPDTPASADQPLWLQINLPSTPVQKLIGTLYKLPEYDIEITTDEKTLYYRLQPLPAQAGFLIRPFLATNDLLLAHYQGQPIPPVRQILVKPSRTNISPVPSDAKFTWKLGHLLLTPTSPHP